MLVLPHKLTYNMGAMTQASSQVERRGDDFTLKAGYQGGAGSLGHVNKLL
jgi:hypothetical protein